MPTKRLQAAAPTATPSTISLTGTATLDLEAKGADGATKRPTFAITGYTGAVMQIAGFYSPVIVDLAGLKASRDRIPIFLDHDPSRIVGQTDAVTIDSSGVRLTGSIMGGEGDAAKVVSLARDGFEWQASIGASIVRQEFLKGGEKAVVNGREVAGPLLIAREARLQETSFVAIGADGQTSASVAAANSLGTLNGDHHMNFDAWLQAKGFDPAALNDVQKASLKAAFDLETAPPKPAPTPSESQKVETLEQILAAQAAEETRVGEITRLTKLAIDARPAMYAEFGRMARAAIESKSTVQEFELATLRASRGTGPTIHTRQGDVKATAKVIEAAICRRSGLPNLEKHFDARTLELSHDQFRNGLGLRGAMSLAARENGFTGYDDSDLRVLFSSAFGPNPIRADGFSTVSLTTILGNIANKYVAQGFNGVETGWRDIANIRPVNDLKTITSATLTGGMIFEKVGPTGELKHATVGETTYTNKADTYGRMFALTREHMINDDLGEFTKIPFRLGRGAAQAINHVFWTAFLANRDTYWSSGNSNVITGTSSGSTSVLSSEGLKTAATKFDKQTDPDGIALGIEPRILLVPPELETTALELMASVVVNTGGSSTLAQVPNANIWSSKFKVVKSRYLSNSSYTGYSATQWFLLADPMDLPTIEIVFLNGRDTPFIEEAQADFGTLGVLFRGFFDYGVTKQEYRASVRAAGA